MQQFYSLLFGACLMVLFSLSASAAEEHPYEMTESVSEIAFKRFRKMVLVKAGVDGQQGYFIFDTGIGDLVLNGQYFGDDDNVSRFRRITDINGKRKRVEGCFIQQFGWAGIRRDSFFAPIWDMEGLEEIMELPLLGLIGKRVFQELEVVIDYDRQRMTLLRLDNAGYPAGELYYPDPRHRIPFEQRGHLTVLQAQIGSMALDLAWDSGASINVLDKKLKKSLPERARKLTRITFGGALSRKRAPFYAVGSIKIADEFIIKAWRLACVKLKHLKKARYEVDGLIGADLFRLGKVSINYRRQEIAVWVGDNVFAERYELLREGGQSGEATVVGPN